MTATRTRIIFVLFGRSVQLISTECVRVAVASDTAPDVFVCDDLWQNVDVRGMEIQGAKFLSARFLIDTVKRAV
jgi:hypothetical protein